MTPSRQVIEVWGRLACFTRPELKVERFSYPVITPSAARGIFDAICVNRHEFRWQILQVEVLEPPAFIALRRNEVKEKGPSDRTVHQWMQGTVPPTPILAGAGEDANTRGKRRSRRPSALPILAGAGEDANTQRQTMALKNVRYRIHAEVRPWRGYEDQIEKMEARFRRIAGAGKCFFQPYFGCREFPAFFRLLEHGGSPPCPG
jgi:CRISPR-associated protein Cas5d